MKLVGLHHVGDDNDVDKYEARVLMNRAEVLKLLGGVPVTDVAELKEKPATTSNGAANGVAKPAVTAPKTTATAPAQKPAEKPAASPPKAEPKPATKPAATAKAAPAKTPPPLDLGEDDEDEPAVGDEPADEPEAAASGEDDAPFTLDGDLPEDIVKSGRLKTVIVFLQERGFHTKEAVIAACEKIKDRVPLLARLPSVADRVEVAWNAIEQLQQGA
jgi:hypothetical protein